MKIGIFSKYKESADRFNYYHGSPCKIMKIIDELNKLFDFEYYINDYSKKYDAAIVDRINPQKKILSNNILGIFETKIKKSFATKFCSISPSIPVGKDTFTLLNYCHGVKINPIDLSKNRSNGVFLGRLDSMSEYKINFLNKNKFNLDIYPIKYWTKSGILRFTGNTPESIKNLKFLQSKFSRSIVRPPVNHKYLYKKLNSQGYKYGFVPSIYHFNKNKIQIESSSKFFEYIGSGIPVLIESRVPEAKIVRNNPFLGEVFDSKAALISAANKLEKNNYNYKKILDFAHKNHYPKSRAIKIYKNFIKDIINDK
jgi:hypothetical protein